MPVLAVDDDEEASSLKGKKKRKQVDGRYVLKELHDNCHTHAQSFISGIADLVMEAHFLSVLQHPHIIRMCAMAPTSPYNVDQPFFLVLDRLYEIWGVRLAKWKKSSNRVGQRLLDYHHKKEHSLWTERISVAHDIASALQYMHGKKYVTRSLSLAISSHTVSTYLQHHLQRHQAR